MRVKELHPLCCMPLETPAAGDQSPELRMKLSRSYSASLMRSDINAVGWAPSGSESSSGSRSFAGVLYKWTNYGKGWRSRWFLLRNGVFSYSKILLPETLSTGEDVRFIGDVSSGRIKRFDRCGSSRRHKHQKTAGIVQLKVIKTTTIHDKQLISTNGKKLTPITHLFPAAMNILISELALN